MLQAEHIAIKVKNRFLFRDFSFTIGRQEKILLQGESGSGKSTLLHAILGFHPLERGAFYFQDHILTPESIHKFRRETVYVPQKLKFNFNTVEELLLFPFGFKYNKKRKPGRKQINYWLQHLELPTDILESEPDDISGGEMQRIVLIASILQQKPLYLMDEPTSAMDHQLRHKVLGEIMKMNASVLVTSHDKVWEQYVNRVIAVDQ